MGRLRRLAVALAAALLGAAPALAAPEHVTIYATQPGLPAYDRDDLGGNPFASAVIETLAAAPPRLEAATRSLTERTLFHSGGKQSPAFAGPQKGAGLNPTDGGSVALVLVFSDYQGDAVLPSLPGAAFDADRVQRALAKAGYASQITVARSQAEYLAALAGFGRRSAGARQALLYTTGHGMEVGGEVWVVPPGFDATDLVTPLATRTIKLSSLHGALRATERNLVLYAGCRDNPLGL